MAEGCTGGEEGEGESTGAGADVAAGAGATGSEVWDDGRTTTAAATTGGLGLAST